jgi:tricorn protease
MRIWLAATLTLASCCVAHAADRLLLRHPAMSKTQIVFEYGGELWSVPRTGGAAHVLASGVDLLSDPIFSPDGSQIAFSGTYDKNTDVYVVSATGGQPRRLTYHPDPDVVLGWTPDGKNVLFSSRRYSYSDPKQLFTVPTTGGFPTELPLPSGEMEATSPTFRVSSGSRSGRATRAASTPKSGSPGCRTPARSGSRT